MVKWRGVSESRLPAIFRNQSTKRDDPPRISDPVEILSMPIANHTIRPAINGHPAYTIITWQDGTQGRVDGGQLNAFVMLNSDELADEAFNRLKACGAVNDDMYNDVCYTLKQRIAQMRGLATEVAHISSQYAEFARMAVRHRDHHSAQTADGKYNFKV